MSALVDTSVRRSALLVSAALLIALVALGFLAVACGSDPYTGTWRNDAANMTIAIHKANDTWLVRVGSDSPLTHDQAAVERDGKLYLGRKGAWQFSPADGDLRLSFVAGTDKGAAPILLQRVEQ